MPDQACPARLHGATTTYDCDRPAGHTDPYHRWGNYHWHDDEAATLATEHEPPAADDAQTARRARREPLLHLLGRLDRGVLLTAEQPLLRAAVETELADADQAHEQAATSRAAATERHGLLEEARDALEAAGQTGPHGDDWPAIAPAIRALAANRDRLAEIVDRLGSAEQAQRDRADKAEADVHTWRTATYEHARRAEAAEVALAEARENLRRADRAAERADARWDEDLLAATRSARARATAAEAALRDALWTADQHGTRARQDEVALTRVRDELDRIAALEPVQADDGRADSFGTGARWTLRLLRAALDGDQPTEAQPPSDPCAKCGHPRAEHNSAGCLGCPGGWTADHAYFDRDQPAEAQPDAPDLVTYTTPVGPRVVGVAPGDHPIWALRSALEGPPVQHYEASGLIKAYYDAITSAPAAEPCPSHDQPAATPELAAAIRAYMGVATPLVTHLARTLGITPQEPQ
jgi:hypothetical protein